MFLERFMRLCTTNWDFMEKYAFREGLKLNLHKITMIFFFNVCYRPIKFFTQTFPNSNRGDLGHSEHDCIYSPWGLSPFSEIPRSVSLTSVVTETKANHQHSNNRPQIIPMCISSPINAQPFNSDRREDCGLKMGLNTTAGYAVAGFILPDGSSLIQVQSWMVLIVSDRATQSWHHQCGPTPWILGAISPLQRRQNLW